MPEALPEALRVARDARTSGAVVSPSKLWRLADDETDSHDDRTGLFLHAMQEAGAFIERATGKVADPCPICGWSAKGQT